MLRRGAPAAQQQPGLRRCGPLVVDRDRHRASVEGAACELTAYQFDLLWILAGAPDQVLSREQLLSMAWNQDFLGDSRLVDNAILRLRPKIDPPDGPSHIETVRGFGYRFRPAP